MMSGLWTISSQASNNRQCWVFAPQRLHTWAHRLTFWSLFCLQQITALVLLVDEIEALEKYSIIRLLENELPKTQIGKSDMRWDYPTHFYVIHAAIRAFCKIFTKRTAYLLVLYVKVVC